MIYLLSQMVLALVLAAVLGAALGWILHRSTQDKESGNLKSIVNRQRQQLSHLQSEIDMLTDDYDELQRQSHDEMIGLREANQQIPSLSTNLEKSQLLVSQMLKKHDSQLRELTTQNQALTEKLKKVEHNEQAFNKLQAELDSARRNQLEDAAQPETPVNDSPAETVVAVDSESGELVDSDQAARSTPAVSTRSSKSSASDASNDAHRIISNARNTSSWASAPLAVLQKETSTVTTAGKSTSSPGRPGTSTSAVDKELLDENLDDVHVVVDEDILGIDDFETDNDINELADATISLSEGELGELEGSEEFAQTIDNSPVIFLNADATQADAEDERTPAGLSARQTVNADSELELLELPELPELPSDVFDVDPFDQVIEIGDDLQKELDDDEQDGESDSFEPVGRHDDLQQIGGIDPQTEKALNELGITSYAQLARLKHHEIETIANALKIVPGRIERDDWVGNARRQLEDVLEEL